MCIENGQFNVDIKIIISHLDDLESRRAAIREMLLRDHMRVDPKIGELLDWLGDDLRNIKKRLILVQEDG